MSDIIVNVEIPDNIIVESQDNELTISLEPNVEIPVVISTQLINIGVITPDEININVIPPIPLEILVSNEIIGAGNPYFPIGW